MSQLPVARLPLAWMTVLTASIGMIVMGVVLSSSKSGLRPAITIGWLVAGEPDGRRAWRVELIDPRADALENPRAGAQGSSPLVRLVSRRRSDFGFTAPIFQRRMVLAVFADDADPRKYQRSDDLALLVREAIERSGQEAGRDPEHLRLISDSIDPSLPWHQDLDPSGIASNAFVLVGLLGGTVSLWRIRSRTRVRLGARA